MVIVTLMPARIMEKASLKVGARAISHKVMVTITPIAASHQGNDAAFSFIRDWSDC